MAKQDIELNKGIEYNILIEKERIKKLELELENSKKRIRQYESQFDCEHNWKVDISFGGPDIGTCKKCSATWES